MRSFMFAALALLFLSGAARAEVWFCEIEQRRANGNWLPPAIALGFQDGSASVLVGMIMGEGMLQADGAITRETGSRTIISFRIDGAQDRTNRTANLAYTVNLNRARQTLTISMRPLGYENLFRASGTCALQEG